MNIPRRDLGYWVKKPVIKVFVVVVAAAGIAWGADSAWTAWQNHYTPSCSWPVRVQGVANGQQAGLVRCYLQGLAAHNATELLMVADNSSPVRITEADLTHSADARAGLATATFTPSPVDTYFVLLTIVYANGVRENTGIINLTARGGPNGWRMEIGTLVNNSGPSPAAGT